MGDEPRVNIRLRVNGLEIEDQVPPTLRLVDFLRDELRLTGTKVVCGEGECGACSIFMDGKLVTSCLILAVEADGSSIITIEGLANEDELSAVQQKFIEDHAVQCGYCIPGMIMAGEAILKIEEIPDRDTIKEQLAGNICRCTGYHKIVDAIEHAGELER